MPHSFPCFKLLAGPSLPRYAHAALVRLAAIVLFALACVPARAHTPYDFCVTRLMQTGSDVLRTRLLFDEHDPGEDLARHLLIRHYRQPLVTLVQIEDYRPELCGNAETHFLALKAGADPPQQVEPARRLPDLGKTASQTANLVSQTYMNVTRQASGALGLVLEATNEALCSMIRC